MARALKAGLAGAAVGAASYYYLRQELEVNAEGRHRLLVELAERLERLASSDRAVRPVPVPPAPWQVEVHDQGAWSTETWNAKLRRLVEATVDTSGLTDRVRLPSAHELADLVRPATLSSSHRDSSDS